MFGGIVKFYDVRKITCFISNKRARMLIYISSKVNWEETILYCIHPLYYIMTCSLDRLIVYIEQQNRLVTAQEYITVTQSKIAACADQKRALVEGSRDPESK